MCAVDKKKRRRKREELREKQRQRQKEKKSWVSLFEEEGEETGKAAGCWNSRKSLEFQRKNDF